MSVEVIHLSKIYGEQHAVDDISFSGKKGRILGFLGPNGAGKSTTMKMITGYLPPSSGSIKVCNMDVATLPIDIRKKIGYLPEHNPLYLDMYVKEYLQFAARIQKLNHAEKRIEEVIQQTGLTPERTKKIGALSKGFRQRVGLAQAILHNPEVLILDEPTTGLDPNQLVEIRHLIAQLGKEKTVIFSTHIMQEVQQLCDDVVIINKGKIVANDNMKNLQKRIDGYDSIIVEFDKKADKTELEKLKNVNEVVSVSGNIWEIHTKNEADCRKELFDFAVSKHIAIVEIKRETKSVESIFRALTQNKL